MPVSTSPVGAISRLDCSQKNDGLAKDGVEKRDGRIYAGYVGGVVRCMLEVGGTKIIGRVCDLVWARDGGYEVLLSGVVRNGSTIFSHIEKVTTLVEVCRRHCVDFIGGLVLVDVRRGVFDGVDTGRRS